MNVDMSPPKLLSRAEAARRIATWEIRPGEARRKAENRVRKRISYAVLKGELTLQAGSLFLVRELCPWAEAKWPEQYDEAVLTGIPTPRARSLSVGASAVLMPPEGREQEALDAAYARIAELEAKLAEVQAELEALRRQRQRPYPR